MIKKDKLLAGKLITGIGSAALQGLFLANPSIPIVAQSLILAGVATFALGLDIASDDVKNLWNDLDEQYPTWKSELANSREFQQAFILTLGEIARLRNRDKRRMISSVFLGEYVSVKDREKSTIERYYRVIHEISLESLSHLVFIYKTILPMKEKMVRDEVAVMNKQNRANDDTWWVKRGRDRMPESQIIDMWIYDSYNINSPDIKKDKPPDHTPEWDKWMYMHS